jgi:hypothetical protein
MMTSQETDVFRPMRGVTFSWGGVTVVTTSVVVSEVSSGEGIFGMTGATGNNDSGGAAGC